MQNSTEAGPLDGAVYAPLDELSRCLHFNALDTTCKKRKMVAHNFESNAVDTSDIGKVLWFGVVTDPSEHNKYGNVSFTISMKKLMQNFECRFYYLDFAEYDNLCITRLLLPFPDKYYDDELEEVDLREHGSPLKRGRWRQAVSCKTENSDTIKHQVEIGIEVNNEDCVWLFDECDVEAVDHSKANSRKRKSNKYEDHICHKFNYFGKSCPYAYGEYEAQDILEQKYPEFFES